MSGEGPGEGYSSSDPPTTGRAGAYREGKGRVSLPLVVVDRRRRGVGREWHRALHLHALRPEASADFPRRFLIAYVQYAKPVLPTDLELWLMRVKSDVEARLRQLASKF